jgi:type I restriction enzyme S subunit
MNWTSAQRIKYLSTINNDALPETTNPDQEIRYLDISSVGRGRAVGEPEEFTFATAPSRARRLVKSGDTIVSTVRTYLRAVLPIRDPDPALVVSTGFAVLRPGPKLDPVFFSWVVQSDSFIDEVVARSVGISYPAINASEIGDIRVPVAELYVQRAIADYLDAETARIDALISKKQQMKGMIIERGGHALLRSFELRGIRWPSSIEELESMSSLGDCRVMHLSQCLEQLTNGYVGPTRDILVDEGVPYIQSLHIKNGSIDFDRRPFFVTPEWHAERPRIHLRENDVLIVQTGDIGSVAVVPPRFGEASCHALQIARVRSAVITGPYLAEFLRSSLGYQSLLSRATGALHPHLEGSIRNVSILVPPLELQHVIVGEVAKLRRQSERIVSRLTRQIELLREHRQALITAAVTGELEIREVTA